MDFFHARGISLAARPTQMPQIGAERAVGRIKRTDKLAETLPALPTGSRPAADRPVRRRRTRRPRGRPKRVGRRQLCGGRPTSTLFFQPQGQAALRQRRFRRRENRRQLDANARRPAVKSRRAAVFCPHAALRRRRAAFALSALSYALSIPQRRRIRRANDGHPGAAYGGPTRRRPLVSSFLIRPFCGRPFPVSQKPRSFHTRRKRRCVFRRIFLLFC